MNRIFSGSGARTVITRSVAPVCAALLVALVAALGVVSPASAATGWKAIYRSGDGKVVIQACGNATTFTPRVVNRRSVRLADVYIAVLRERDGSGPSQFIQGIAPGSVKRGVPMKRFTTYVAARHRGVVSIRNKGRVHGTEGRFNTELLNSLPRCP